MYLLLSICLCRNIWTIVKIFCGFYDKLLMWISWKKFYCHCLWICFSHIIWSLWQTKIIYLVVMGLGLGLREGKGREGFASFSVCRIRICVHFRSFQQSNFGSEGSFQTFDLVLVIEPHTEPIFSDIRL